MEKMVDPQTVCCMCGDVGFPDKLFRCSNCRNRLQHSYCSNYYRDNEEGIEVCDWCQCEETNIVTSSSSKPLLGNSSSSKKYSKSNHANEVRSTYSGGDGDRIKLQHDQGGNTPEKAAGKTPSPRPTTRRYKLLKDVMC